MMDGLTEARFSLLKAKYAPKPRASTETCLCCLRAYPIGQKHTCRPSSGMENQK